MGSEDDDGSTVLACVVELEDVCRDLAAAEDGVELVVEDAGDTMDALVAGGSGYDGWVTLAPWSEVVGFEEPADAPGAPSPPVASTEMLLAVPNGAAPCGDQPVGWRCLGDQPGRVGLPPRTTALGLLLVGNAASGYFGRADIATNDFETDPGFDDWLDNLTSDSSADPLSELLRAFPPTRVFESVGTTRASFDRQVPPSRASDQIDVVEPDPLARAEVVVVPIAGGDDERVAELAGSPALADSLTELGWGEPPDDTGLPNAGVLYDLLTR